MTEAIDHLPTTEQMQSAALGSEGVTMETKFTKGPWELQDGNHPAADGRDREIVSEHTVICGWWAWDDRREERLANAHLIAAAPDLYEALEAAQVILRAYADPTNEIQMKVLAEGEATLAKARGEQ